MTPVDETKWLCDNSKVLERYSGKWVVFSVSDGIVFSHPRLHEVLKAARKLKVHPKPFVLHVPSKKELDAPLPGIRN